MTKGRTSTSTSTSMSRTSTTSTPPLNDPTPASLGPLPADRVVLISAWKGHRLWGRGSLRGVINREPGKGWHWRAWDVVGPRTLGKGLEARMEEARARCMGAIEEQGRGTGEAR